MKYEEINTFITVSKYLNISQAARALGISSTACKYNIHSLESELGAPLIISSPGQQTISFTEHGHRFIPLAYRWVELWQETQGMYSTSEKPTFAVAMGKSLYTYMLNKVHIPLTRALAPTQLFLSTPSFDQATVSMTQGRTQIALYTLNKHPEFMTTVPIITEDYTFVCALGSSYPYMLSSSQLDVRNELFIGRSSSVSSGDTFTSWHRTWFSGGDKPILLCDGAEFLSSFFANCAPNTWSVIPASIARTLLNASIVESRMMTDGPLPRTIYALTSQYELYSHNTTLFFNCLRDNLGHQPGLRLLI